MATHCFFIESEIAKMTEPAFKLTSLSHGAGCGCKIGPAHLARVLKEIPMSSDPCVLVDTRNAEDAAVYQLTADIGVVLTVDYISPTVDDPYDFGRIAATNSLNDVYAMGGRPTIALNLIGFPTRTHSIDILTEILRGGVEQSREAGISIVGGHSVEDPELKYGLVVLGSISPDNVISNATARPGDVLLLTKPIGTGVISTAIKCDAAKEDQIKCATKWMTMLGKAASDAMIEVGVSACTDVTGFGLLGHLVEMMEASQVGAIIQIAQIPVIEGVRELITKHMSPSGAYRNMDYFLPSVHAECLSKEDLLLVSDPQTAGGFIISVSPEKVHYLQQKLLDSGCLAAKIGEVTSIQPGHVRIVP